MHGAEHRRLQWLAQEQQTPQCVRPAVPLRASLRAPPDGKTYPSSLRHAAPPFFFEEVSAAFLLVLFLQLRRAADEAMSAKLPVR